MPSFISHEYVICDSEVRSHAFKVMKTFIFKILKIFSILVPYQYFRRNYD